MMSHIFRNNLVKLGCSFGSMNTRQLSLIHFRISIPIHSTNLNKLSVEKSNLLLNHRNYSIFVKDDLENLFEDENKYSRKKPFIEIPDPKILDYLTEENINKLTENITAKIFKIDQIKNELRWLNRRKFPLPDSLNENQWKDLVSIRDRIVRLKYIDAIRIDPTTDCQNLFKEDEEVSKKIVFTVSDFDGIAEIDDLLIHSKVTMLNSAINQLLQEGESIPLTKTPDLLKEVYLLRNRQHSYKFLSFYGRKRQLWANNFIKKRVKQIIGEDKKKEFYESVKAVDHIKYGLGYNSLFIRFSKQRMLAVDNWRTIRELNNWGQPLVIDFSFVKDLTLKNARSLINKELFYGLLHNRVSRQPFAIYVTNFDKKCPKCRIALKVAPDIFDPDHPIVFTEKSYMELFPKKNLLYLTPDSRNTLKTMNGSDIYIVGGLFQTHTEEKTTLAKAKSQGIRHACLPLKSHIGFNAELNLDHMIAVLADYRDTQDWFYTCRWIPSRFFRNRFVFTGDRREEAVYHSHHSLSPQNFENLISMKPKEYRRLFSERIRENMSKKINTLRD